MKNQKAQALIEFVLILPVLIMLLFAMIDFGRIMVTKSSLENKIVDAYDVVVSTTDGSTLYEEVLSAVNLEEKSPIKVEISYTSEGYMKVRLIKEIQTITPGLNLIIGYPYRATAERVIRYEKQ